MENDESLVSRRQEFSRTRFRPSVDNKTHDGSARHWFSIWSFAKNITKRYMNHNQPIAVFEIDIHDLWYDVIKIAQITPADAANADRIVAQIIRIRELGVLERNITTIHAAGDREDAVIKKETAVTSSGAWIWIDLPFLVADLRATWTESIYTMTAKELENLAGFTARLAECNVCGTQTASCALILFRAALESPQRILRSDTPTREGFTAETTLEELMPAVFIWLYWGSHCIWKLCSQQLLLADAERSAMDENWAAVGELASRGGVSQPGFTRTRMNFWKKRLLEIPGTVRETNAVFADKCIWSASLLGQWDEIMGESCVEPSLTKEVN
ncbi:hypothetical protein NLG97_g4878 [Lecanicillium saksenae]|uniref:Uncharacterized protein n=1 Tax=Lecanicillium saksenae TaxID=468837 RepID=A0ACC1QXY1_9HYPO|nr:hypothetical protein NLG97_g4878 [Lecanicillium saksenae]